MRGFYEVWDSEGEGIEGEMGERLGRKGISISINPEWRRMIGF